MREVLDEVRQATWSTRPARQRATNVVIVTVAAIGIAPTAAGFAIERVISLMLG